MCSTMSDGAISANEPYGLRLQGPHRVDHEISVGRTGWGSGGTGSRDHSGDCEERGLGDSRGGCESGPSSPVDHDCAAPVGVPGAAIVEGQELNTAAAGVAEFAEKVLGAASVGTWLLGGDQRQRDRRSVETVHRESRTRKQRRLQGGLSRPIGRPLHESLVLRRGLFNYRSSFRCILVARGDRRGSVARSSGRAVSLLHEKNEASGSDDTLR